MNFLKRALYAIVRKKTRTIIMLIILFLIANVTIAGIAIKNATSNAKILAREKLGSKITLSYDSNKAFKTLQESEEENKRFNITYEEITLDTINSIMTNNHIKDVNYIVNTNAYASSFSSVVDSVEEDINNANKETQEQIDKAKKDAKDANNKINKYNKNNADDRGGFMPGGFNIPNIDVNFNIDINMANVVTPDLTVVGVKNYELDDNFTSGNYTLVEGIGIIASDEARYEVMIEQELALKNEIKVGDTIKIKATNEGEDISLTVVGIYKAGNVATSNISGMSVTLDYNKMYIDYNLGLLIKQKINEVTLDSNTFIRGATNSSNGIDKVVFNVDDPINIDSVLEDATTKIDDTKFTLDANKSEYESMIEPINNVASFSNILVIIVVIFSVLILTLILILWIKERVYEIGILLSMGENKAKIMFQYIIEVIIIAIVAFALSIGTGNIISQKVGDLLLSKEVNALTDEDDKEKFFRKNEEVEVVDNIDVSINMEVILKLYGIGLIIIILSSSIPTIMIFRYNPRKVLALA